jgi:GH25 family lysozyme M1 (1,4-beta-N-acetylmuramidase)
LFAGLSRQGQAGDNERHRDVSASRRCPLRKIAFLLGLATCVFAHAGEFDHPWKERSAALVIDPFYDNPIRWELLEKERRVVAVIHKSTIGKSELDPGYFERKAEAKSRGYLWGSYHWGVAGDPVQQADFYIDTVKPEADELIALDLEDVTAAEMMSAREALLFIERVRARTGRYPVLYTNHASAALISRDFRQSAFTHTPLWYARFRGSVDNFPAGVWNTYTLWQFSSEIKRQIVIPGTQADMDVNVFNGSIDELRRRWPLTPQAD